MDTVDLDTVDPSAGMQLTLRPVDSGDAESVSELIVQLGYDRPASDVRQWIAGLASRAEMQVVFVACLGSEIAGWIEASVELRLQTPPFTLIGGLVVRNGSRGRGIGRKLCEHVEGWSQERGIDTVRVTSRSTREDAHRFYQRDGYRHTKTSLVFEKKLSG